MATVQAEGTQQLQKELDIVSFVNNEAAWKELLIELVQKNQIDPWNIDLVEIVGKYVDAVKKLKIMDLRVPANIILAAAILLRLKSNLLNFEEEQEVEVDGVAIERPNVLVEELNFRLRLPPKRKLSLTELIEALEEAIQIKETRQNTPIKKIEIPVSFSSADIEKEMEELYRKIRKNVGKDKMTTFNELTRLLTFNDVLLQLFIPILFLAHQGKITILQERFFGEIIITVAA